MSPFPYLPQLCQYADYIHALMIQGLGCVALEDMIVVEQDGHQPLSTTGRELLVLPAN